MIPSIFRRRLFSLRQLMMMLIALSTALLIGARAELLTDAALFLLLPLISAFVLLLPKSADPLAPFTRGGRSLGVIPLVMTLLFFLMLPIGDLLASPLFSEEGLCAILWHYRITRLAYLFWNLSVLLPASIYSVYYCFFRLTQRFLLASGAPSPLASGAAPEKRRLSTAALLLLLAACCCLLSALPSTNGADTSTIWYGSVMEQWSDWHPVTYRFFVKLCSLVYYSRFTVTFVQTVAFCLVGLCAISLLDRVGRRGGGLFVFFLLVFFTPFFSLQEMSKDVAFTTALLGLTLAMLNILHREQPRFLDFAALFFHGYFLLSFRHAGALPLLGGTVPLIIFGLVKNKKLVLPTLLSTGCAFLCYFLVVNVLAFQVLGARKNPDYIKYGTPMSIIASVVKADQALEPEEEALLQEVMPLEKWGACFTKYYPGTVSREYSLIGEDINKVTEKNLGPRLTLLSIKLMARYPAVALGTLFDNAAIVWKIACPADQTEVTTLSYPLTENQQDPMDAKYTGLTAITYRVSELVYQTPVLRSVSRRGGAAILCLLFSGLILLKKRRFRDLLPLLPVLALVAGLMITVPSPSTSYALPVMEIAALMVPYALLCSPMKTTGKWD